MKARTLFLIVAILLTATVFPQTPNKNLLSPSPSRAHSRDTRYGLLNISNITAWQRSDGYSNHPPQGFYGSIFPRGKVGVIFQDGIVWGGQAFVDAAHTRPAPFNQLIRVGGATYRTGSRAGRIIGFGANAVPSDSLAPEARVYRVRRDYFSMSEEELRRDAAEVYEIAREAVTTTQMQIVHEQYEQDWNEWPVAFGAPFIDRNGNGQYDPPPPFSTNFTLDDLVSGNYDEPGIAMGDLNLPAGQVLWTVCNDLDVAQNQTFAGAHPLGLELQFTLWSYRDVDELQNVFFRRVRLINKGGVAIDTLGNNGAFWIDQMHLGQWVDPDLGNLSDDRAGCDLELNMGYAYNAYEIDEQFRHYHLPPAAVGVTLLQGPRLPVSVGTALFDFKSIKNWRNQVMTAFINKFTGTVYSDPARANYEHGALYWYKWLRGYVPVEGPDQYYPFPPGETPGPLPYSGDPVANTGFTEELGGSFAVFPGERRMLISSGPFACAPGDTQEAVYACVGGLGADRLSSIAVLRQNARAVQNLYNGLYSGLQRPATTVRVSYANANEAAIFIRAETQQRQVTRITARLESHTGNANPLVVPLFDDGQHGDALPNDGVFAASLTIPKRGVGLFLDILANENLARSQRFNHVVEMITTIEGMELGPPEIFSDNINQDRVANPGENVRYGFLVRNLTDFELHGLRVTPLLEYEPGKNIFFTKIAPRTQTSVLYNGNDPTTFLSAEIPGAGSETSYHVPMLLKDRNYNCWKDTLTFAVVPLPAHYREAQMEHTNGTADGNFEIRIITPQDLKNHEYQILGVDSIDARANRGFTLKDATENRLLLQNHPLPDTLGHNMSLLEGFKILRGTIPDQTKPGMANWSVPSGKQVWSWQDFVTSLRLEGFNGAIGWDEPHNRFGIAGKTLKPTDLKNTLIRFAQTDTNGNVLDANDPNWSFAYRYGRGFANPPARPEFVPFILNPTATYSYQDFKKSVPFSAWDIEASLPRRLAVGFLENNVVNGMVDGKYWPPEAHAADNVNANGPREWFFIFSMDYSEIPVAALMKEMLETPLPLMWWGTPARNGNIAFEPGDEFLIEARHLITAQDVWSFNPTALNVAESSAPLMYSLSQNYPNPFNPETHVAFSLPHAAHVRLEIFNLMGQRVSVMIDQKLVRGKYTRAWRGVSDAGESVASGVYFCRLEIGDKRRPDFVQTRKLLLLR